MKNHIHVIRLTFAALFSAIIMLTTMIAIPLAGGGYIHPGDSMIYAAAWFLGPLAGAAAAIGSALSDIILGYAIYAPATFVIKGLMGFVAGVLIKRYGQKFLPKILAMVLGGLIMAAGYFVYEYFIYSLATALADLPGSLIQMAAGVIIGTLVIGALGRIKGIEGFTDRLKG